MSPSADIFFAVNANAPKAAIFWRPTQVSFPAATSAVPRASAPAARAVVGPNTLSNAFATIWFEGMKALKASPDISEIYSTSLSPVASVFAMPRDMSSPASAEAA